MAQIGISLSKLTQAKTLLIGIKGSSVPVKGVLEVPIHMGTPSWYVSL